MPDPVSITSTPVAVAAGTPVSSIGLVDVEFQFSTGEVSVTRSLDNVNYVEWPIYNKSGANPVSGSLATTPGIYGTDGGGYLKFSAPVTVRSEI